MKLSSPLSLKRQRVHQHGREVATLYFHRRGYVPPTLIAIVKATASDEIFLKWGQTEDCKSNPNQPRVPAGLTTGGEFTADGSNGGMPTGWGGDPQGFTRHYNKHKKDFAAESPQEYVDNAKNFYQKFQDENLPAVQDIDGYTKVYDPETNIFGVYNPDGDPVTLYKPTSPGYFDRQIEKVVDEGGAKSSPLSP